MSDERDIQQDQDGLGNGPASDVPVEELPMEVEPARRSASAQLVVDADVGSAAALREAMDPANRSLTDALQLSFRVLQLVIVVLLVLFVFSGFKTVGTAESGVATVWGRIVDREGLQPGLQMNWPPPIGEFVLFKSDGREVDGFNAFMSRAMVEKGIEKGMQDASQMDQLLPGQDGSFLTQGGQIAHVRVRTEYSVVDPVKFLRSVPDGSADSIVRVAVERAVVHVGLSQTLENLQSLSNEEVQELIGDSAQTVLNDIESGMRITSVMVVNEIQPPLYIQRLQENFSEAKQNAAARVNRAETKASDVLITAAGQNVNTLAKLMREYEEAWEQDLPDAGDRLAAINAFFDGDEIAGQAANAISSAQRFQSLIDQTLGREARRFAGLLPAYRKHPELVIAEKWLEAYGSVMGQPDAEIMYVPSGLGSMGIDISGLESVRDIRRRADLEARKRGDSSLLSGTASDYMMRADEITLGKAQRQLNIDSETGAVKGMRDEQRK
ncbi:MAG: hypothetical protein MK116_11430 [Phycisphaerales bacterium]|nr:hypothetical protein [Phycisphaerales bacterium]